MTKLSDKVLRGMVEDSYNAWKLIIQNHCTIAELLVYLNECDSIKFRLREIRRGLENNLTYEQIKVYARPEFDWQQMRVICLGFISGFNDKQIDMYARPEFKWRQMYVMYYGYSDGLTDEQVSQYAKPELDEDEMMDIYYNFIVNTTKEQIQVRNNIRLRQDQFEKNQIDSLRLLLKD